jgi:glycosyltransferase involved in cell wall biosynthesis
MAGPDPLDIGPGLRAIAERLGVSERVVWPGMISGDLKWGAIHACDAFVLCSHQENFGVVVAEALACGKPTLISNKVNIWREVELEGAGIVADDTLEGAKSLLARWKGLSEASKSQMVASAKPSFEKQFEIGISIDRLVVVLGRRG